MEKPSSKFPNPLSLNKGYVTTKTNCLLVVKFIKKEDIQSLELIPQMVTQLCTLLSESHSTFNFHSKVTQLCTFFSESHSTLNFNSKVTQLSTLSSESHSIY